MQESNVVHLPKAGVIPPLDCEYLVSWLDHVRREMTNGQPWQPARMAHWLHLMSREALEVADRIERAGNVPRRCRFVVRRAPKKAVRRQA